MVTLIADIHEAHWSDYWRMVNLFGGFMNFFLLLYFGIVNKIKVRKISSFGLAVLALQFTVIVSTSEALYYEQAFGIRVIFNSIAEILTLWATIKTKRDWDRNYDAVRPSKSS